MSTADQKAIHAHVGTSFRPNCWYVAGWRSEVTKQGVLARTILGEELVFWRDSAGHLVALADRCSHRHAPLSLGTNEGNGLRCPYHGLKFDRNGRCIEVPCQADVGGTRRDIRTFKVVERDAFIWIWPGDVGLANPALIPDYDWLFSADWVGLPARIHYQAPEALILDNLLDLSHVAFVHATTLGGTKSAAHVRPTVERLPRGVRMTNWHLKEPLPPYYQKIAPGMGLVDRWFIAEWSLDANVVTINGGSAPEGLGANTGRRVPGELRHYNINAITPETANTTHYFYAWRRNFAQDDAEITNVLARSVAEAFEEDRRMIEAQTRNIRAEPMLMIKSDMGLAHARKLINQRVAEGGGSASTSVVGSTDRATE